MNDLPRFVRPTSLVRPFLVAVALLAVPAHLLAAGIPYLPLAVGNSWEYQGVNGLHETQTVTGTMTLLGRMVYVISYSNSSSNTGLQNYWLTEADGDVRIAGFFRSVEGVGVAYDPPVRVVDAPLAIGKTWSTTSTVYTLPGMTLDNTYDFGLSAFEEVSLTVPAGTFDTFGIGQILPAGPARAIASGTLAVDGTLHAAGSGATQWYAAGVGQVQYSSDDLYQLTAFNIPTPVASTTWGKVKHLYR